MGHHQHPRGSAVLPRLGAFKYPSGKTAEDDSLGRLCGFLLFPWPRVGLLRRFPTTSDYGRRKGRTFPARFHVRPRIGFSRNLVPGLG
jgi:hypothetical protein